MWRAGFDVAVVFDAAMLREGNAKDRFRCVYEGQSTEDVGSERCDKELPAYAYACYIATEKKAPK